MSDEPRPLTEEQRARLMEGVERLNALQRIAEAANQALAAEALRFQNADVTRDASPVHEEKQESGPNLETLSAICRDANGEIFAARGTGELICWNQDIMPQPPFHIWIVDDGRILQQRVVSWEDGQWLTWIL